MNIREITLGDILGEAAYAAALCVAAVALALSPVLHIVVRREPCEPIWPGPQWRCSRWWCRRLYNSPIPYRVGERIVCVSCRA